MTDTTTARMEMPRYTCHKQVWALKIADVIPNVEDGGVLSFEDKEYGPVRVSGDYLAKHAPKSGGYYVVYADGYQSFSPAAPFEDGYTPIASFLEVRPSPTADTRTCDFANVSKETLLDSSNQHIADVRRALAFFIQRIGIASARHDYDKLTDIDRFHADFVTGFVQTSWWERHRQLNRHHLNMPDGVREDVNLIDVLDYIADCVMAGMARSGSVYPLHLDADVLDLAFQNTVSLLKSRVQRVESGE